MVNEPRRTILERLKLWINPVKSGPVKPEAVEQAKQELDHAYENLDKALANLEQTIKREERRKRHG